jgi:hypothetical protein
MARDESSPAARLDEAIRAYRELKAPRFGVLAREFDDVDVDMYEEDAFLHGLALAANQAGGAEARGIRLHQDIDERLQLLAERHRGDPRAALALEYRASMQAIADALNSLEAAARNPRNAASDRDELSGAEAP